MAIYKAKYACFVVLFGTLFVVGAYPDPQEEASRALLRRLLPNDYTKFSLIVDPHIVTTQSLYFKVSKKSSEPFVLITGNSGVSVAWGLHYYLRNYCNCHISWDGDQLELPELLPDADVEVTSSDQYRYYQNVCTFGYSSAWWEWPRWEREIDWMALQGINLPLAFIGQEAIFKRVYQRLGLAVDEINDHFVGPAFLPWGRMGNIRGWGGPLSDSWHGRTVKLQHQILARMRSLGMKPVLPAFAGFVPQNITRIFPDAKVARVEKWCDFEDKYCCPTFLDPADPLFSKIGEDFISEMIVEWGTDHFYNCDMFNEIRPTNESIEYIRSVGESVFAGMQFADSEASWIMQGWLFVVDGNFWSPERTKALLTSVPQGKMIVLDLNSDGSPAYEKYESYYGQPFIWNTLHNFGGTLGMYGYIDNIGTGISKSRAFNNTTMIGTGLTMEGINQNYIVYDYTLDMGYRTLPADSATWVRNYTIQRYGMLNEFTDRAWTLLKRSLYSGLSNRDVAFVHRPGLLSFVPIFYNIEDVVLAWDNMYEAVDLFKNVKTYLHDLVDVTRQVLQDMFSLQYIFVVHAYKQRNLEEFRSSSKTLMKILYDMEDVLNTNAAFMLGPWLESAKLAAIKEDRAQFEYNARSQITIWGPNGEILDYAAKQWGGLVRDYSVPRWTAFVIALENCILTNKTFDKPKFNRDVFKTVEEPFTFSQKIYPTEPKGSILDVLPKVYETWRALYTSKVQTYRSVVERTRRKTANRPNQLKKLKRNRYNLL